MKKMKKLSMFFAAILMMIAMVGTAFAEGTNSYTITVENSNKGISINGLTYSAYKIFNVTYEGMPNEASTPKKNVPHSYTVAEAFKDFEHAGKKGEDLIAYVESLTNDSDALNGFAKAALKYATEKQIRPLGSAEAADEKALISLSEAGYYLVAGEANVVGDDNGEKVVASCGLDTTNASMTVQVKADAPSIKKEVYDSKLATYSNAASKKVGDTVDYKITSKVPSMIGYDEYTYTVTDTFTSGLTLDVDSIVVKIADSECKKDVDYTVAVVNQTLTIDFKDFIQKRALAGKKVVITYSAIINENALTKDTETNSVTLEYSNDPLGDTTNHTPESKVYVYDFDIVIDKYETNNTNKKLAGAKFVLYKMSDNDKLYYHYDEKNDKVTWYKLVDQESVESASNANKIDVVTTDENGSASFKGLEAGTYSLQEIEAPKGYNLLKDPVAVSITVDYNADGTVKESSATSKDGGQYKQVAQIANNHGLLLPSTGGMGTTILYIAGGILVLAAAVMMVLMNRKKAEN